MRGGSARAWAVVLMAVMSVGCRPERRPAAPVAPERWQDRPSAPVADLEEAVPVAGPQDGAPASDPPAPAAVSLDLREADIRDVLRLLAEVGGVSIVASDDVVGTVTIRLHDTPWEEALASVAAALDLRWARNADVIKVATLARWQAEQKMRNESREDSRSRMPLEIAPLRLRFARAAQMAELLAGGSSKAPTGAASGLLSERGSLYADEPTNTLIVHDTAEAIGNIRSVVAELDVAVPQVLIESTIVEISAEESRSLGVQWGARGGDLGAAESGLQISGSGLNSSARGAPFLVDFPAAVVPGAGSAVDLAIGALTGERSLDLRLTALEREGKARIISRPRIVTLNNKAATIKSLTVIRVKLPSSDTIVTGEGGAAVQSAATERIETGIVLVVTPQVAPEGQILLDLFAKSSQADFSRAVDGIPTETSREANAHVLVRDGQTFALGGIYARRHDDSELGTPFLRSIPVLGWFFEREDRLARQEDLLVFLTPRVLNRSSRHVASTLSELERVAEAGMAEIQPGP